MHIMPRLRTHAKALTAVFFIALVLLGIGTSLDYGQPWDEPWEQDILRMNLNEYAAQLGLDTRLKMQYVANEPGNQLISQNTDRDHGLSAYYPVFFLASSDAIPARMRMILWHMYTWLWFMAGVFALYAVTRRLGLTRPQGCAASLFAVLWPRLFANGHYNNKDIILFSLVLLLLWLTLRLIEKPGILRAALFGLAGALATNTKIIGLFLFGLCALYALVMLLITKRMDRTAWISAVVTALSYIAFYWLLTPAAWGNPVGFITYTANNALSFSRWEERVLFRGTIFFYLDMRPVPWYYLPYMMVVTTPLWLLLLMGMGQVRAALRPKPLLVLCTLLWAVPMAYVVIGRPVLYNGWRHFYFLGAPLLVLAAYGLKSGLEMLKRSWRRIAAIVLALVMGTTAVGMALSHPKQYTYYNVLLWGKDLPTYMELDYWNVSVVNTLQTLLSEAPGTASIAGIDSWTQAGLELAYDVLPEEQQKRIIILPENDPDARYYLVNPSYAQFSGWDAYGMQTAVQTMSYGVPIYELYLNAAQGGGDADE